MIPKGEYGGGPMIVWDRGVFENISEDPAGREDDLEEGLEKGDLKLFLLGEKIRAPTPWSGPRTPATASSGC